MQCLFVSQSQSFRLLPWAPLPHITRSIYPLVSIRWITSYDFSCQCNMVLGFASNIFWVGSTSCSHTYISGCWDWVLGRQCWFSSGLASGWISPLTQLKNDLLLFQGKFSTRSACWPVWWRSHKYCASTREGGMHLQDEGQHHSFWFQPHKPNLTMYFLNNLHAGYVQLYGAGFCIYSQQVHTTLVLEGSLQIYGCLRGNSHTLCACSSLYKGRGYSSPSVQCWWKHVITI